VPAIPPYIHRSPFGNNSVLFCPSERCIILWAVTARASPTGWFSTSWLSGSGFRLRLPQDRRRFMFGHHASGAPRRVDSLRGDREAASNSTGGLRSHEIGLQLAEVAVDGCIAKAPCGGEKAGKSPVDRGKQGIKRSTAVDGRGIPIGGVSAPANRHDSPLLVPTLERAGASVGGLPDLGSVHLDRGYDSSLTRERLKELGLNAQIAKKGQPAPLQAGQRWVVERTNFWHNAHKKLAWCTERVGRVIDFWVAFSEVIIIVRRLIREGWMRYRWESRPPRQP
jgi:hypothetical protein